MSQITESDVKTEVGEWIDQNWDPELTVAQWWQLMADARLSHTMLSEEAGGRGWSRALNHVALSVMADKAVLGPPTGLGMMLAAPTIATHGTDDQIREYIPKILNGQHAWCQLFSEPGAGSDLAGLQCKAEKDGDEWVINGQKVWTSGGKVADMGMLIARTDPDLPKHQGISYFAFSMKQKGVDVRPLTEMTGRALFNEVFITERLWKSIIAEHPFVVHGNHLYLQKLRELGFKTFGNYFDESYDLEENHQKRVSKIVETCKSLKEMNWQDLYLRTQDLRKHNRNLFFNKEKLGEQINATLNLFFEFVDRS